jgi:hypothetical protein
MRPHAARQRPIAAGIARRHVRAGAERVAFRGQDNDADIRIVFGALETVDQLLAQFTAERIAALWPVERYRCNVILNLIAHEG